MKCFSLKLRPLSSWCTPWHADTLFAALCWQARLLGGVRLVESILDAYRAERPPFVISDCFPAGWLPCPLSFQVKQLPGNATQARLPAWLRTSQLRALLKDPLPLIAEGKWAEPPIRFLRRLHTSTDRLTTQSNALFQTDEICLDATGSREDQVLELFVKTETWLSKFIQLLEALSKAGFGKKRSWGHGAFELLGAPEPCEWIDCCDSSNAFVSLSHFVPAPSDPSEGCWSLLTKYPKFSPMAPVSYPFKGRLMMIRPGSVFRTTESVRPYYGRILQEISTEFKSAIHYALAFSLPINWPVEEQDAT
jgi:CRISPR-associated protein Csm4